VAARKSPNNARRDEPKSQRGKSGSLITGLFIGLVIGLVVAAGLAWYFNIRTPAYKTDEEIPPTKSKADKRAKSDPAPPAVTSPAEASAPVKPEAEAKPSPAPASDAAPSAAKPRVDYTFYGILPGDKPAKPVPPPVSKDVWWLQVAALKNPVDADKLKARLSLLGLQVAMQKVDSGGSPLYRIRVGPYQREDDALGDLDTLAANDFEPRLFKEPNTHPASPKKQEKP
jgi:cell division protein FtsN